MKSISPADKLRSKSRQGVLSQVTNSRKDHNVQVQAIIKKELVCNYCNGSYNINRNYMDTIGNFILISLANNGEIMTEEERNFKKVQGEAIELIKNKKGNKIMKAINSLTDKPGKAPKVYTFTFWGLVGRIFTVLLILAIGAFAGITIQSAINSHIESRVSEQVKSFTTAVEVKK